jgi:2-(1,2-epoxy-1,2-dihydrophenyl)acetyl-CoA isomerase
MDETPVMAALDCGVLTLTLNRPQRLNAMSQSLIVALKEQLERARGDAAIRAVLLTGTGRGFCAGADLAGTGTGNLGPDGKPDLGEVIERLYNPLILAIREIPKPVIGAVNGVAAGGGANLALACDILLAARSARFDQAFVRISLLPDLGGTYFLSHIVGDARARALALLGTSMPADEALRAGLVWQVVDDAHLMDEARKLATRMAAGPTLSYAVIKQAMNQAATNTLDQQLDFEARAQKVLNQTADYREGVAAFLAKRPANFQGH